MRIERLENGYKLTDLYVTASILCDSEMEFVRIEANEDKKQTMFVIKGDPIKIRGIMDAFFNGKYRVDANMYKNKVQALKSRLYANF